MSLAPGTRLGPYEVVSHLGAGGMGEVYRARDTRLDRSVAIKVVAPEATVDPRAFERLRQEAHAASRLSHPHICALYDVGEEDGTFFLVMEQVKGRTLANRLEEGPLPLPEVLRHGIEMANALAAAHREGVVHRDLKPGNVMLTRDGVKLLDFGLARLQRREPDEAASEGATVSALTAADVVMGTVPYMAPEQLEGRQADARTDLYALGVVLYEMASGRRPFVGESQASVIAAILTATPPPLPTLRPLTPPALDWVVQRCLEKDPEQRWQCAADLAAVLERMRADDGAAAISSPPARRRRRVAYLAALGAVAALLAAAIVALGPEKLLPRAPLPRFQRLTFRPGTITAARFAPDGQTIVFTAAWQGGPHEIFSTRLGSAEARPLGLERARLAAVSSAGEMAFVFSPDATFASVGTLSRAPLAGGAPRPVLEGVRTADWLPDGSDLAIVRRVGTKDVVELPVGHPIHEGPDIWALRVSPAGDRVAFLQGQGTSGDLMVLDRSGRPLMVSKGWREAMGVAWSPGGDEVWLSGRRPGSGVAIHAVSLRGDDHPLVNGTDPFALRDVFRDGRMLVEASKVRFGIACLAPGESDERELGWLDGSLAEDLSADGRLLLIYEGLAGGGPRAGIYVRATDGAPAVRIGDGRGEALSPDGRWVFAVPPTNEEGEWRLLPTGAGTPRRLQRGTVKSVVEADWLADGKRIVFNGREQDGVTRLYVLDVDHGPPRRLAGPGVSLPENAATGDGLAVIVQSSGGPGKPREESAALQPADGGKAIPLPALDAGERPLALSADRGYLYVRRSSPAPAAIDRLEIASGARNPWRTLSPRDPVGLVRVDPVLLLPDGHSYCYSYVRVLSDLFLVEVP